MDRNNHDFTSHSQHRFTEVVEHVVHCSRRFREPKVIPPLPLRPRTTRSASIRIVATRPGNGGHGDIREDLVAKIPPLERRRSVPRVDRVEQDSKVQPPGKTITI
jgi:hypothetical protein